MLVKPPIGREGSKPDRTPRPLERDSCGTGKQTELHREHDHLIIAFIVRHPLQLNFGLFLSDRNQRFIPLSRQHIEWLCQRPGDVLVGARHVDPPNYSGRSCRRRRSLRNFEASDISRYFSSCGTLKFTQKLHLGRGNGQFRDPWPFCLSTGAADEFAIEARFRCRP